MDTRRHIIRMFDEMLKATAGIPSMSHQDSEVSVTLTLNVQIIGRDSLGQPRKLEITFNVVNIGRHEIYDPRMEPLYRAFVEEIGPELTHTSDEWACLECALPATDTVWFLMYTPQIPNPGSILIGAGCKTCALKMRRATPKAVQIANRLCGVNDDQLPPYASNILLPPSALTAVGFGDVSLREVQACQILQVLTILQHAVQLI
ncbi:hypothetical protein MSAN_00605700 [Mycena sanguinolenta]|uniref:Uncharacterized protein n=1 Tax=Mycena sanguinolenta TaxID=230812 RepID=A0A8H7DIW9_9AGAR|nr:hypothetical protein MSAN_00605700 [Mycena sanguinolenta]